VKIVHLNTYTDGGAAEAALRLHSGLLKAGEASKFLALYKGECTQNEVYDFRNELKFPVNLFNKFKNKIKTSKNKKLSETAGELFSETDSVWKVEEHSLVKTADIVHLHWISDYVNIPSFFRNHFKAVWTLHDHFLFSGGFHYPPPKKGVVSSAIIEDQRQTVKKIFFDHPIDFVCPSENLKSLAVHSGILDKCRFHVIKNPVDTTVFRPLSKEECRKKLDIPSNEQVLFFLSDHIHYHRKGYHLLEKALSLLKTKVVVITAGRGQLPSSIGKAEIKQFGLVKDKALLNELYNACDVLVNPSLDDISSNTIIEAMACGKPSVAFHSGGVPELISDVNGILAGEKTAEALASSIQSALQKSFDSSLIISKTKTEHDSELIAKKYLEVYRQL